MQQYELRLANKHAALPLISIETYFSDAAAIRAGKLFYKNVETIEVWRGDVCVYKDVPCT